MLDFKDILKFTDGGSWECDYDFKSLIQFIDNEVEKSGLQLNPDFQRGCIWTDEQSSKFIEFVLQGGKTAKAIYLNKPSWQSDHGLINGYDDYVCVDGLQRITAIRKFMNNEIKAFGHYYREFSGHIRGYCDMRVNINDLKTKEAVLRWYLEMNSGGVIHTKEELDRVQKLLDVERMKSA